MENSDLHIFSPQSKLQQMTEMENSELFQFVASSNGSFFNSAPCALPAAADATSLQHSFCSSCSYIPLEASEVADAPTHQDRTLAALKNHKETEKRRRERINSHLNKLRTLLPCNSKIDKASLLAKVVQRVKELKQQTSELTEESQTIPSETDEITVLSTSGDGDNGRLIFKASLCCEDRSDLIPDLIEILKSLRLKTIKAEMATLGGRTRNVLVVAAEKDHSIESIQFLQNSLKTLLERSNSSDRSKRRPVIDRKLMA